MRNYQKTPFCWVSTFIQPIKKCLLRCVLTSFFYTCSFAIVFGQLDSLEQLLTTLPANTEKVDILNQLSYKYHRKDVQQTFTYADQALALATALNYVKGIAYAKHNLSIGNILSGDSEVAKQLNKQVVQVADSLQDLDLLIIALNLKAFSFTKDGKPLEAMTIYQQALEIAKAIGDKAGYSGISFNLGEIHTENKNFKKARVYYNQALVTAIEMKDPARIAWANWSIGDTYTEEKRFTEAATFLKTAIKEATKAKDNTSLSFAKSRLGKVYMELGEIKLSEIEIKEAIQLIQSVGDKEGLMENYIILMNIYLKNKQLNKVIDTGQKATKLLTQVTNIQKQLEIQALLAKAYAGEQNFQKAYQYNLLVQEIKDSLDFVNKQNLATEIEEKYQSKHKDAENAILRAEQEHQIHVIEQQKAINFFLAIVAILLALLGYAAFNAYKNKRRNNVLLEEKVAERTQALQLTNTQLIQSNEELERFAYVTSHDLREPLQNITNFTSLLQKQLQDTQQDETLQYMDIIHKNAIHLNRLIVDTLEFTRLSNINDATAPVDLNKILNNIESSISNLLIKKKATIELVKPLPVVQANNSLLFSVFKNVIENGIIYNESLTPTIKIDHAVKGEDYLFSIADNGIGIPKAYQETIFEMFKRLQNREKYQGSGMGLSNCKKIIHKLGGKMWVESDGENGATFFFTLPVSSIVKSQKKVPKNVERVVTSV